MANTHPGRLNLIALALLLACLPVLDACKRETSKMLAVSLVRDGKSEPDTLSGSAAKVAPSVQNVSCALRTTGAPKAADCSFVVRSGQIVFGPYQSLPAGHYTAEYTVAVAPDCLGGRANLDVSTNLDQWTVLSRKAARFSAGGVYSLAFNINDALADQAALEFRAAAAAGGSDCFLLKAVKILRP
ncbi:MAG TPA: hypothetical protein VG960_06875 [Caulobacteraceae bacterium]|nr:hypothetical protein [Caulobacteraceae bacterium]